MEREAQRLRELEAAQRLAAAERQRADEQKQAAHHLRQRAIYLSLSLVGAFLLMLVAIAFARQANQNYQAALEQTRLATAHELASAALNNLDVDQERSILLAMQAVKTADIPEAENALHQAILSARLRDTLTAHTELVYGTVFSKNSTQGEAGLATASQDDTIKIWKLDETGIKISREPLVTISNPTNFSNGDYITGINLAFSPDGKQLAAIGNNYSINIWDTASGKLLKSLWGNYPFVIGLAYSPTEKLLAASRGDGTVKIWDARTWQELQTLSINTPEGGPVAFSQDGKHLATGEWSGGEVMLWDRTDEAVTDMSVTIFVPTFSMDSQLANGVFSIAFSPDGKQLAIGSNEIKVYDISAATASSPARLMLNIPAHQNSVIGLFYNHDGTRLISASGDGIAKVWNAETGQALFTLPGNAGPVISAAYTSDGEKLFTSYSNGEVKVWDLSLEGDQEWLTIPNMAIGFDTRSGNRLVNLNVDPDHPKVQVIEVSPEGVRKITSIPLEHGVPYTMFDTDKALSRLVVLYPDEDTIHVFNLSTGQELSSFSILESVLQASNRMTRIDNIKLSPDGTRLLTANDDGEVYLWDVQSGDWLEGLYGHIGFYGSWDSLDFSPDGTMIATANSDGSVRIWDAKSRAPLHTLAGHTGQYSNVDFSEDGKLLLATGEGTTVNLWNTQTGQLVLTIPQFPTYVNNLEISPDAKYLAVARLDGITQLWDASTGQELLTLPGSYVKFTADGKHLLAWKDGILYGYILDINELMVLARTRVTRSWTPEECSKFLNTEVCPPAP